MKGRSILVRHGSLHGSFSGPKKQSILFFWTSEDEEYTSNGKLLAATYAGEK